MGSHVLPHRWCLIRVSVSCWSPWRSRVPLSIVRTGGDRRANSALYTIVLTRLGRDQCTRDYAAKRSSEGKSTKEIIRCLKRYVAREVFPLITAALPPATTPNPAT
jgi:hypothetical protein